MDVADHGKPTHPSPFEFKEQRMVLASSRTTMQFPVAAGTRS